MARPPFHLDAAEVFELAASKQVRLFVSAVSFTNIHYIVSKIAGPEAAIERLLRLSKLATVLDVTGYVIAEALSSKRPDFEDAVQYYTALSEPGIQGIITRDKKGFPSSKRPVLTPAETIKMISTR